MCIFENLLVELRYLLTMHGLNTTVRRNQLRDYLQAKLSLSISANILLNIVLLNGKQKIHRATLKWRMNPQCFARFDARTVRKRVFTRRHILDLPRQTPRGQITVGLQIRILDHYLVTVQRAIAQVQRAVKACAMPYAGWRRGVSQNVGITVKIEVIYALRVSPHTIHGEQSGRGQACVLKKKTICIILSFKLNSFAFKESIQFALYDIRNAFLLCYRNRLIIIRDVFLLLEK